ncbi:MAG: FumA C-terminus/TtdB family hydratase beta subunit [Clostridia bacterium]
MIHISSPFTNIIETLKPGDIIRISGVLYVARDAAHRRMAETHQGGGGFPFDIRGQGIYYAGPCPEKPGHVIGSIGPTTSGRMDPYTPLLLDNGLKVMIGKGLRSREVIESMKRNRCVYLGAAGGCGALISRSVKHQEIIAFPELGPEALRKITVEDFPAVVIIDAKGKSLYERRGG